VGYKLDFDVLQQNGECYVLRSNGSKNSLYMEIRIMLGIVDQQRNDAMLKARNEQLREEAIIASGTYFRGKDGIVYRKSGPNGEPKKV